MINELDGRQLPNRPEEPEEVYTEWDNDYQCWGVFGLSSGFCYAQFDSKTKAEKEVENLKQAKS